MQIKQGEIIVGISDLYNSMSEEDKREFLQNLAWEEDIFEDTVSDILKGVTGSNYNVHIRKAREKILGQVEVVERSYIKDLLREIDKANRYAQYFRESLWDLQRKVRAWNFNNCQTCGEGIDVPQYNDYPDINWDLDKFVDKIIENCKNETS